MARLASLSLSLLVAVAGCATGSLSPKPGSTGAATLEGTPKKWHPMALRFVGPPSQGEGGQPNPFLDYRLQVTFVGPDGKRLSVPGFFDGDGQGGSDGDVWRVRFTPDQAGPWRFVASFRSGPATAISLDENAGTPAAFHGASGSFDVAERDDAAPGFLAKGRLEYVGGHYFKQRDGGYWIKTGTDDPEDFLAYAGFRNTVPGPLGIHRYAAHEADHRAGDPDWGGGKGRGIIGALNYLAEQKVNSIYFLPMNIGGDGQNTWPFAGKIVGAGSPANENLRYDVGKLAEWEIVFAHAQRRGIALHVVLGEAEPGNKRELDDGALGPERKLYYREIVARFAHHNGVVWNLSEEYDYQLELSPERVKEFAGYLAAQDPYRHPITVHNQKPPLEAWDPFLGDERFSATSIQYHPELIAYGTLVEELRARSRARKRPIPVAIDEFDRAGRKDDDVRAAKWPFTSGHSRLRKAVIWPVLLSGGHIEFILDGMLQVDDFRPFEPLWRYAWHARKFMEEQLPFWEMEPADELIEDTVPHPGGAHVLAKRGQIYAVYLPRAAGAAMPTGFNLKEAPGPFTRRWYNPRTGAFVGTAETVTGGQRVPVGDPPGARSERFDDWVLLFVRAK